MSGPKDSCWSLSKEERKKREEERRKRLEEECRKILEEKRLYLLEVQINSEKCAINSKVTELCSKVMEWIKKGRENLNDSNSVQELENSIEVLKRISIELTSKELFIEILSLENYLENLKNNEKLELAINSVLKCCAKVDKDIQSIYSNKLINNMNSLKLNEDGELDFSIKIKRDDVQENLEIQLKEKLEELNNKVNYYINNEFLVNKSNLLNIRNAVNVLLNNTKVDTAYRINQIKMYVSDILINKLKYDEEIQQYSKLQDKYSNYYVEYTLLCEKLNVENKYSKKVNLNRLEDNISAIEKECEALKGKLAKIEDYEYIVKSISEVMEDLGHDIISSEIVERPKRSLFDNIYEFEDDNAINVYTSDNGTIMFEVTGISNEKKELSSLEKLKIKESMGRFCKRYELIKEKLKEKGIVLTKENLRPADEKYARVRTVSREKFEGKKVNEVRREDNKLKQSYIN